MSIKTIADGYYRLAQAALGILPEDIAEVAATRYATCLQCENMRHDIGKCSICGCILKAKTKAMEEECPIGLWKKRNDNEEADKEGAA